MGDPNAKSELTTFDKISVGLYRSGIVLAMLCIVYAAAFFYHVVFEIPLPFFLSGPNHTLVFWIFVSSVCFSISFLHLYSRQILNVIRSFAVIGFIILVARAIAGEGLTEIIYSKGVSGKIGVAGWGFIMAAFAGIGAKEAYCFRLKEGYAYGILSAILVLTHLFGLLSQLTGYILILLIAILVVTFTVRKLRLPLHYDIGDKSKY